jgi:hypothetical protein
MRVLPVLLATAAALPALEYDIDVNDLRVGGGAVYVLEQYSEWTYRTPMASTPAADIDAWAPKAFHADWVYGSLDARRGGFLVGAGFEYFTQEGRADLGEGRTAAADAKLYLGRIRGGYGIPLSPITHLELLAGLGWGRYEVERVDVLYGGAINRGSDDGEMLVMSLDLGLWSDLADGIGAGASVGLARHEGDATVQFANSDATYDESFVALAVDWRLAIFVRF